MLSLAERIKRYEAVYRQYAVRRMPLIIRVDGRAFHTFTKGCEKPFDNNIVRSMVMAAIDTALEMQGFKVGYVQSDEATFCITDYDSLNTGAWFEYCIPKIVSITASLMSVNFNKWYNKGKTSVVFDCRAFSVPKDDVANVFLWRAKDWERNSLQMYARSFFSHKDLLGKKHPEIHEMLHKIGKNWATDLDDVYKNGTFLIKEGRKIITRNDILPNYESVSCVVNNLI